MLRFYPFEGFVTVWQHVDQHLRLFAFALVIVAMLSFVGAARAWLALRRIRKAGERDSASVRAMLAKLERGCAFRAARLQVMFYLFAAAVSWALVGCYAQFALSKVPVGMLVLRDMEFVFAFAYACSLVFVVVHVVQWIVASRVSAARG
jgi:hypothetical protein